MLVPRPTCSHVGGAAPKRIAPDALSLSLRAEMSQQQTMLDLQEAQSIFNTEGLLGGIWLPDQATMTQDSAGQTAAASGAVVGYVKDVARPDRKGSELFAQGSFDSSAGFISSPQCSISGGVANIVSSDGSYQYVARSFVAPANRIYRISFEITRYVAGQLRINHLGGLGTYYASQGTGTYTYYACSGSSSSISLYFDRASGVTDLSVDNVSITEVVGNYALQNTTANKPLLQNNQGKYWLTKDSANTSLSATFSGSLGNNCTVYRGLPTGVSILTGQSISTTYDLASTDWYGSIVLNRAASPYEDRLFRRILSRYTLI